MTTSGTLSELSDGAQEAALLDTILGQHGVRMVYQPLVELDTGALVGFEALARGPEGTALERPDLLFAAARRGRRLADLDRVCRAAALGGARAAGLAPPYRLFINSEPEALEGWRPGDLEDISGEGVILELTERALTARPAQLLQTVARARAAGWGIALDDVGADPASLALLPMLRPDVIKLDLRLVQQRPTGEIAAVMNAVHAEAERSGSLVLAEGLETEDHVQTARAFGATLGQGWFFGRPGPLPAVLPPYAAGPVRILARGDQIPALSPFALAASVRTPRAAVKPLLIEISKQLEAQARNAGEAAVVLAAFQHARFFTSPTRRRYEELAATTAFVAALGEDMPPEPLPGVRGAVLHPDDPVRGEWDVVVLGPHFAATLVARDLGDDGPDAGRRFEFVLSHDRELTVAVANALMSRVWPEPPATVAPPPAIGVPAPRVEQGAPAPAPAASRAAVTETGLPVAVPPELLQCALAATSTGVTIADVRRPDSPLIWMNRAFGELTGYPVAEVLGRNCRILQGPRTDPAAVAELSSAIRAGQRVRTRLLNYRRDGTPWWNEVHLSPVFDAEGGVSHYIGVQNDVTARIEAEERVRHFAYHDALTELPNRSSLVRAAEAALQRGRDGGSAVALLSLDLDDFGRVNDRHGHGAGDELLRLVAGRLHGVIRADDVLARQGGDEFLLLLPGLSATSADEVAERVAEQVLDALREPFALMGGCVTAGASIGVSLFPRDASTARDLLRHADAATYAAKRRQGRRVHLYGDAG